MTNNPAPPLDLDALSKLCERIPVGLGACSNPEVDELDCWVSEHADRDSYGRWLGCDVSNWKAPCDDPELAQQRFRDLVDAATALPALIARLRQAEAERDCYRRSIIEDEVSNLTDYTREDHLAEDYDAAWDEAEKVADLVLVNYGLQYPELHERISEIEAEHEATDITAAPDAGSEVGNV